MKRRADSERKDWLTGILQRELMHGEKNEFIPKPREKVDGGGNGSVDGLVTAGTQNAHKGQEARKDLSVIGEAGGLP